MKMKRFILNLSPIVALSVNLTSAQAGDFFHLSEDRKANRIKVNSRFGFNIDADFRSISAPQTAMGDPGPESGGGIDREYESGYVRVDSSENADGKTWYWGYTGERPAGLDGPQVDLEADTIAFDSRSASGGSNSNGISDDPQPGIEISYQRYIGEVDKTTWGVEGAFTYLNLSISDGRMLSTTTTTTTDYFSLGGIIPPLPPYEGSFSGPGPVISDEPFRRTVSQGSTTVTGERKLDGSLYGIRVGPFVEIPLFERTSLQISGGLAAVYAHSEFSYNEMIGASRNAASSTDSEWLWGGYAQGNVMIDITETMGIFGGVQFQALENFKQQAGNRESELHLGASIFANFGMSVAF